VGPKQIDVHAIEFRDQLANYTLWDLDRPELYEAAATLLHGATVLDHVRDTFGIRRFEVRGERFFVSFDYDWPGGPVSRKVGDGSPFVPA
jgi:hypothetical protein